ncbi:aldehyde dehydrogenase family protein [Mycobacterium xenopi 3993]|nr:aldehyde dehydrogenase family protein [Mycobacterium xenopi 3993]
MTRLTLELGGKSAQVVFDDADLDAAANGVVAGCSPPLDRLAWRVRVCWCMRGSLRRWWTRSLPAPPRSSWAIPRIRRPRWVRSQTLYSTKKCCRTSHPPASRELTLCVAANPKTGSVDSSSSLPS